MDGYEFTTKMAEALAWPVTAIAIVVVLRKEVLKLIPKLTKLEAGPLKAEFEKELLKVEVEAKVAEETIAPVEVVTQGGGDEGHTEPQDAPSPKELQEQMATIRAEVDSIVAIAVERGNMIRELHDAVLPLANETAAKRRGSVSAHSQGELLMLWNKVLASARKAAGSDPSRPGPLRDQELVAAGVPANLIAVYTKLRGLRNVIAHASNVDISLSEFLSFEESANSLIRSFERFALYRSTRGDQPE